MHARQGAEVTAHLEGSWAATPAAVGDAVSLVAEVQNLRVFQFSPTNYSMPSCSVNMLYISGISVHHCRCTSTRARRTRCSTTARGCWCCTQTSCCPVRTCVRLRPGSTTHPSATSRRNSVGDSAAVIRRAAMCWRTCCQPHMSHVGVFRCVPIQSWCCRACVFSHPDCGALQHSTRLVSSMMVDVPHTSVQLMLEHIQVLRPQARGSRAAWGACARRCWRSASPAPATRRPWRAPCSTTSCRYPWRRHFVVSSLVRHRPWHGQQLGELL